MGLQRTSRFGKFGIMWRRAVSIFLEILTLNGGVQADGQRYDVCVITADDGPEGTDVVAATALAAERASGPLVIFGPYSSGYSKLVTPYAASKGAIYMSIASTSSAVVASYKNAFSIFPTSSAYMAGSTSAVAAAAEAIDDGLAAAAPRCLRGTCKSSIRVGAILEEGNAGTRMACEPIGTLAASNGLGVVKINGSMQPFVKVPRTPTRETVAAAIAQLRAAGANVIPLCIFAQTVEVALEELERTNYSPLAVFSVYGNEASSNRSDYLVVSNPWFETRPGIGEWCGINSETFADRYRTWFGEERFNRVTASMFTGYSPIAPASRPPNDATQLAFT